MMKKYAVIILICVAFYQWLSDQNHVSASAITKINKPINTNKLLENAYKNQQSNVQVNGVGTVIRILSDDKVGSRHQKFILRLSSGQTLLVAHNIDLAPRVAGLSKGDPVQFFGEYEWNNKGGVIHWTHHDPNGRHVGGWLKHNGRTYQ